MAVTADPPKIKEHRIRSPAVFFCSKDLLSSNLWSPELHATTDNIGYYNYKEDTQRQKPLCPSYNADFDGSTGVMMDLPEGFGEFVGPPFDLEVAMFCMHLHPNPADPVDIKTNVTWTLEMDFHTNFSGAASVVPKPIFMNDLADITRHIRTRTGFNITTPYKYPEDLDALIVRFSVHAHYSTGPSIHFRAVFVNSSSQVLLFDADVETKSESVFGLNAERIKPFQPPVHLVIKKGDTFNLTASFIEPNISQIRCV
jgi:hypothetical protein